MKKFFALLFSCVMLCSVLSPMLAYAGVNCATDEVKLLQAGDFEINEFSIDDLEISQFTVDTVEHCIYSALYNYESQINLKEYSVSVSDVHIIYTNVINDNPDLFYVSSTYEYSYSSGKVLAIKPRYSISQDEISNAKSIFERGIKKALKQVDSSMNDAQKALVIHDYIAAIATYPTIETMNDDKESYHSAYGLFYDGNVVCAGYSLVYSAILKELGIPCKYVASIEMGHAWNSVQIDGKWYNVDITFDDLSFSHGENYPGNVLHDCFLKSDEAFSTGVGLWHYGIEHYTGVSCDDTKYDDYFWNDIKTNIYADDGDYIYSDFDRTTRNININRRTVDGTTTKLNTQKMAAFSFSITQSNQDGTESKVTYIPFSKFIKLDSQYFISYIKNFVINSNGSYSGKTVIESFDIGDKSMYNLYTETANDFNFTLGIFNGEIGYTTYYNRTNTVLIPRMEMFNSYYDGTSTTYNPYIDGNNDKVINAKDYALIYNESKGL